jgi:hypothetical protein
LIENQYQRDGDEAEAHGAKRRAGDAISDPGARPGRVECASTVGIDGE